LWVGEVGIGDRDGDGRPIGGEPAAEAVGVVARTEVVVARFTVAFFAFEFVVLRATVGVRAFAAVWVEVRVVAECAAGCGDEAGVSRLFILDRC